MFNVFKLKIHLVTVFLIASCWGSLLCLPAVARQATESGKTEEVVAEGKGSSPKEALEDAFRSAVRQVVGAVVEAKTLVENDELIEDKVLTYSGAFITKYEEVPGSSKVKDGVHSVKITAVVERKTVIAKLQSANITVKEVDGESMFAELTTKLEAEKGAAAIIEEKLKGFPENCVSAFVSQEKPKLVKNNDREATYEFLVEVSVNYEAFRSFSKDLSGTLSKVAVQPVTKKPAAFLKNADEDGGVSFYLDRKMGGALEDYIRSRLSETNPSDGNHSLLLLADSASSSRDSIDYQFVWLDNPVILPLYGIANKKCQLRLELLSKEKEPVKVHEITLPMAADANIGNLLTADCPWGDLPSQKNAFKGFVLFWLSPVFHRKAGISYADHVPKLKVPVQVTMPIQDWQLTKEFKVELSFVDE